MGNIGRKDILAVILGITVIGLFLATQVQSAEFCASDATELQNHLNTAAIISFSKMIVRKVLPMQLKWRARLFVSGKNRFFPKFH